MHQVNLLLTHQRAELNRAQSLQVAVIFLQLGIAVLAAMSVLVTDNLPLMNIAIAGFIVVSALFFVSWLCAKHKNAGDEARRTVLIASGSGYVIPPPRLRDLRTDFSVSIEKKVWSDVNQYFRTTEPPGSQRLMEMVEESAFWTSELHKTSFWSWIVIILIFTGAPFGLWWYAAQSAVASENIVFTRMMIALFVFLVSSHVLGAAFAHLSAHRKIKLILARIPAIAEQRYPHSEVVLTMGDYNATVEAAPMILPLTYRVQKKHLQKAWDEYWSAR